MNAVEEIRKWTAIIQSSAAILIEAAEASPGVEIGASIRSYAQALIEDCDAIEAALSKLEQPSTTQDLLEFPGIFSEPEEEGALCLDGWFEIEQLERIVREMKRCGRERGE